MPPLHLSILPPAQRRLWGELSQVPETFVLYGGTAIALQLGHRESLDFDFFARVSLDPIELTTRIPFLADAEPVQVEPGTLTARVDRDGPVLVSFFGVPKLPRLREPLRIEHPRLRIGDLLELGGMKALVVQKRAEAKDYLDIHAILTRAGLSLADLLAAGAFLYGRSYAPESTLKALAYYEGGDLAAVPASVRSDLLRAVRACDPARIPSW
jgi:hypothetical protein